MKLNDFSAVVSSTIDSLVIREIAALEAKENGKTASKDEQKALYEAHKAIETRISYLKLLQNDALASKAAQFIKDEKMLLDIASDAYSLSKYADMCRAIASKSIAAYSDDSALSQALAFLSLNEFKTVKHDTLRKNLFGKTDTSKCHVTDRQASMICKLFERLGVAKRVKIEDVKATEFDTSATFVKSINSLYA